MTLQVDVSAVAGDFRLEATFASSGGLTALFGPSGSGKTSLVELIGGIRRPDSGRIALGDTVLVDVAARVFVPPYRRRIGWVFQEGRLFPHLTGRQNLNYGRWFNGGMAQRSDFERVVALLGLEHLLDRRPDRYSGGERSRVAIGRALLANPRLLLMDEPLAALDDDRKAEILPYIERLRDEAGVEIVYVTHSIAEVARLATRVVLLAGGRVLACGPTSDVLQRGELGAALGQGETGAVIDACVVGHDAEFGLTQVSSRFGTLHVSRLAVPIGHWVRIRIRARDVLLATTRPSGISALNVFEGRILGLKDAPDGSVDVSLDCGGDPLLASVTRRSARDLGLQPGLPVYAIVKSVSFDRAGVGRTPTA